MADVSIFTSTAQAFFWMFVYFLWLLFMFTAFFKRGTSGQVIGLFNIAQVFIGIIAGIGFIQFSTVIGMITIMTGVGIFLGLAIYDE